MTTVVNPPPKETTDATQTTVEVLREFLVAYADALRPDMTKQQWATAARVRQLTWRGASRIPLEDAVRCYGQMGGSYNEFEAGMIAALHRAFPDAGIEVTPAREYSVAVYLHVPGTRVLRRQVKRFVRDHFRADEISWEEEGTLRVWWD